MVDGVDAFVDGQSDVLAEPREWAPDDDVRVPGVVGSALTDLMVTSDEYARNGWKVVGEPKVVAQQVVRRDEATGSLVVRVCVDNSDVRVVEKDGSTVPNSAGGGRSLNVVTLFSADSEWVVQTQRVAARPDC